MTDIALTTLPNGLRVVTERVPHARTATLGCWVGVGARDEPAAIAGVSHFLEHLLFKGTATRSAHDLAEAIDAVGGEMNAFTSREHTTYYARVPGEAAGLALDVLGDVVGAPALRADDVEAERQVILEEIALEEDEPEERVHDLLQEGLFPEHPLGWPIAGSVTSIPGITRDDVAGFFDRWYRPSNLVVSAAGDIDHDDVVSAMAARFDDATPGDPPARTAPGAPAEERLTLRRPTEQAHVAYGWRACGARHPDRHALALFNHVLGGGMSSRLFARIREERGLAYSVYSSTSHFDDAGCLVAYVGTSPKHVTEVEKLLVATVEELLAEGVSARELEVAKGYVRGSVVLGLEDSASRMVRIGANVLVHGEVIDLDTYLARIDAVTQDDLARVAAEVCGSVPTVACVGPRARTR